MRLGDEARPVLNLHSRLVFLVTEHQRLFLQDGKMGSVTQGLQDLPRPTKVTRPFGGFTSWALVLTTMSP